MESPQQRDDEFLMTSKWALAAGVLDPPLSSCSHLLPIGTAMPHFIIEYSANLEPSLDIGSVVELVRHEAAATGVFPLGGIRVRAIPCPYVAIADGSPDLSFLDMVLRIGEGRDLATRQRAGTRIFDALSRHLDPIFNERSFALSFDIQINDAATSWKRNNIHERVGSQPRSVSGGPS